MHKYETSVQPRPDDAAARISLAQELLRLGRTAQAADHLKVALQSIRITLQPMPIWGAALANLWRISEALPHLERAVQLNPSDQAARRNLEAARSLEGR